MNKISINIIFVITSMFSFQVSAYSIGDTVNSDIAEKLSLAKDKITLVDFFASWCKSCEKEIPGIKKIAQQNNINVIGIDVDDELSDGLLFQKKLNIDFPVINDTEQDIISAFKPIGMPAMYYIQNNKIIGKHIGAIDDIDLVIQQDLLAFEE